MVHLSLFMPLEFPCKGTLAWRGRELLLNSCW
jgi:hypothetical protein